MTTDQIRNWIATPANIQALLINIGLSAVVLFTTYLIIKILSSIIDRVIKERNINEENTDSETDNRLISDNLIRSTRVLLKTLLLYGGYFFAAILILQIFQVKVISVDDLKTAAVKIIKIVGVLVGARLAVNIGQITVKQIFERHKLNEQRRAQTLEALLRNVLTYIIFFLAALMIMEIFNVNTSAILASAGILGLAVGFGAQNLVKDIISGFFILFEDQFSVGDFVETAGIIGTVEEIGLRTCKIRQWTGQLHIIPNGEITRVTNYNRGHMMAVVTVGIAYEEDIDRAIEVLKQESYIAYKDIETILDEPQVQGVTELADSSVNIRTVAPTAPGEQWVIERELRRRFKYALDRAGIEIPYPRRVLYQREEDIHILKDQQYEG
ncbi:small conductance mechanosensitive channel [Desulfotomaculum arcticum]|uniref:Small conductance mechanosensitive channel n=1 Tax=Desulfotruncus arcticus DSM 17038 TaxID=1121424 RepID=A0A1I2UF95_9FIRM|nr:mechanosensitive ion channel family protein [Desulfotruncus arcticus]SFG75832.1 small conductance mechanosensitive channel [Desulfotomaculum arcticum] [Desulfotruncus arcticus DSM 17038]